MSQIQIEVFRFFYCQIIAWFLTLNSSTIHREQIWWHCNKKMENFERTRLWLYQHRNLDSIFHILKTETAYLKWYNIRTSVVASKSSFKIGVKKFNYLLLKYLTGPGQPCNIKPLLFMISTYYKNFIYTIKKTPQTTRVFTNHHKVHKHFYGPWAILNEQQR